VGNGDDDDDDDEDDEDGGDFGGFYTFEDREAMANNLARQSGADRAVVRAKVAAAATIVRNNREDLEAVGEDGREAFMDALREWIRSKRAEGGRRATRAAGRLSEEASGIKRALLDIKTNLSRQFADGRAQEKYDHQSRISKPAREPPARARAPEAMSWLFRPWAQKEDEEMEEPAPRFTPALGKHEHAYRPFEAPTLGKQDYVYAPIGNAGMALRM
jgi:hypothetical protein